MSVPPYIVACLCCITGGFAADKLKTRGLFMIAFNITAIVGLVMLIASDNPQVKYAGCFFFASGIYPNVPQGVAWNGNNIGGSVKRAVGIAMHVGFGKSSQPQASGGLLLIPLDMYKILTADVLRKPWWRYLWIYLSEQRRPEVHHWPRDPDRHAHNEHHP